MSLLSDARHEPVSSPAGRFAAALTATLTIAAIFLQPAAAQGTESTAHIEGPAGPAEWEKHPDLFLEGAWHIEWKDHPELTTAQVSVTKGLKHETGCGPTPRTYDSCRDLSAAWSTRGVRPPQPGMDGAIGPVDYQFYVREVTAGEIRIDHGAGTTSTLRRAPGSAGMLLGTWENHDGETGQEIWRRAPPPKISHLECRYGETRRRVAAGEPCPVEVTTYPGKGAMRGNLPGMVVDIYGSNLADPAPRPLVIDTSLGLEISGYCYLYEKPSDIEGERHTCWSWGLPYRDYGDVVGVRLTLNLFHGATPGVKTFGFGASEAAIALSLPALPEELEQSVDLVLSGLEPEDDYLRFLVRNAGERDATKITVDLSATQESCMDDGDCEEVDIDLADVASLCPLDDAGQPGICGECPLGGAGPSVLAKGPYLCGEATLAPGESRELKIARKADPRTDAPEATGKPGTCISPGKVEARVSAAERDADESNNVADSELETIGRNLKALRFVAIGDKMARYEGPFDPVSEVFAGQNIAIEGELYKPICDRKSEKAERPVWVKVWLSATKFKPGPMILTKAPDSSRLVRSGAISVDAVFSNADAPIAVGSEIVAERRSTGQTARVKVAPYHEPVLLKLSPLDAFDQTLPGREVQSDGRFLAEAVFLDKKGPVPDQDVLDLSLDVHGTAEGPATATREVVRSSQIVLTRERPGYYRSPPQAVYLHAGWAQTGLVRELRLRYLYAKPDAEGRDRLTVDEVLPRSAYVYAKTAGDDSERIPFVPTETDIYFEIEGAKTTDMPESFTVLVALRKQGEDRISDRMTLTAKRKDHLAKAHEFLARTATVAFGIGGIFPGVRERDEIRAHVAELEKETRWLPIVHTKLTFGRKADIQVLPADEGSAGAAVTLGRKFQVRLLTDENDDATSLRVVLSHERNGRALKELPIVLERHEQANRAYLSSVMTADGAIFGGLAPDDVIRATYSGKRDDVTGEVDYAVTGTATVVAPDPVVQAITLENGGSRPPQGGRTISTAGIFRATVTFETPPYEDAGALDLRVVRDGETVAMHEARLMQESPRAPTAVTGMIALAGGGPFGDLSPGDRIEARYRDGGWAPSPSAALTVVATAGKPKRMRFLEAGKTVRKVTIGTPFVVEVELESAPAEDGVLDPVTLDISTGGPTPAAAGRGRAVTAPLRPAGADGKLYRTKTIVPTGPSDDARSASEALAVAAVPGDRLRARFAGLSSTAAVENRRAKENEGTLRVAAFDRNGKRTPVGIDASGGSRIHRFTANRQVHLPAGDYTLYIDYPLRLSRKVTLEAGKEKTVTIAKSDIGGIRIDLRDGSGNAVAPREVEFSGYRTPAGTSRSGRIRNASAFDLPRGLYDFRIIGPNGLVHEAADVAIRGGQITDVSVGAEGGRIRVELTDAEGKPLQALFSAAPAGQPAKRRVLGKTSSAAVDAKGGLSDVYVDVPFEPMIENVRINPAQVTEVALQLGRLSTVGYEFAKSAPSPVDIVVTRLTRGGAGKQVYFGKTGELDLPPGRYQVKFNRNAEIRAVDIAAGETATVTQQLRLGRLEISVGNATGKPYFSRIEILRNGRAVEAVKMPRDFSREPLELAPGSYQIRAKEARDFRAAALVVAGKTSKAVIDDYGRIVFDDSVTLAAFGQQTLYVRPVLGAGRERRIALDRGQSRQERIYLPPGRYALRIIGRGGRTVWRDVAMVRKGLDTKISRR